MAPELFTLDLKNSVTYSENIDIWSFGVLLYQLIAKKKPFTGESFKEIIITIVNDTPDYSQGNFDKYSKELIKIIQQMLEKNP